MCVEAIRTETAGEARNYYQMGGKYIFANDNRVYTYIKNNDEIAQFQSPDGFTLLIPLESLGMYLPDVSSVGMELTRVEE